MPTDTPTDTATNATETANATGGGAPMGPGAAPGGGPQLPDVVPEQVRSLVRNIFRFGGDAVGGIGETVARLARQIGEAVGPQAADGAGAIVAHALHLVGVVG